MVCGFHTPKISLKQNAKNRLTKCSTCIIETKSCTYLKCILDISLSTVERLVLDLKEFKISTAELHFYSNPAKSVILPRYIERTLTLRASRKTEYNTHRHTLFICSKLAILMPNPQTERYFHFRLVVFRPHDWRADSAWPLLLWLQFAILCVQCCMYLQLMG